MEVTDHRQIITPIQTPNGVLAVNTMHRNGGERVEGQGSPIWVRTLSSENQVISRHELGRNGRERHLLKREQHGQSM